MKRVLIVVVLIVLIFFGYSVIVNGFGFDPLNIDISGYETIEKKSNELTKAVASYDKKNEEEYKSAVDSLNSSIKSYENSKDKYESLIEELGSVEEENSETILAISKRIYEIDFLLTTLGTYADKEGVDVTLNIVKGNSNLSGAGYVLCNLQFIVSGPYINISNFIEDLEGDDKLEFEIRDYKMIAGSTSGSGEVAEFMIYNIPINSSTFIESSANNSNYSYIDSLDEENNANQTNSTSSTGATTTTNNSAQPVTTSVKTQ